MMALMMGRRREGEEAEDEPGGGDGPVAVLRPSRCGLSARGRGPTWRPFRRRSGRWRSGEGLPTDKRPVHTASESKSGRED
jgi:hypothetical protein